MATSLDLRRLLAILDIEGFGYFAGEILAEISAGRVVESKPDPETKAVSTRDRTSHVTGDVTDEDSEDEPLNRVPIPLEDQLGEAIAMLRFRLIEPARRLAEAERLASELMDRDAVRFDFRDDEGVALDQGFDRARPGDDRVAKKLDELLFRILDDPSKAPA